MYIFSPKQKHPTYHSRPPPATTIIRKPKPLQKRNLALQNRNLLPTTHYPYHQTPQPTPTPTATTTLPTTSNPNHQNHKQVTNPKSNHKKILNPKPNHKQVTNSNPQLLNHEAKISQAQTHKEQNWLVDDRQWNPRRTPSNWPTPFPGTWRRVRFRRCWIRMRMTCLVAGIGWRSVLGFGSGRSSGSDRWRWWMIFGMFLRTATDEWTSIKFVQPSNIFSADLESLWDLGCFLDFGNDWVWWLLNCSKSVWKSKLE